MSKVSNNQVSTAQRLQALRRKLSLRQLAGPALAAALLVATPLAHAELYGYVDENGVAHLAARKLDARYRLVVSSGGNGGSVDLRAQQQGGAVTGADRSRLYDALARHPNLKKLAPVIAQAAQKFHVDAALLKAVIAAESGFDSDAVSPKGAVGLMQVLPTTGERYGLRADARRTVADKLTDPRTNVLTGARYLRDLQARYPDRLELVLASYNAGEGAVARHADQIPPYAETRDYVAAMLELYRRFNPEGGDAAPGNGVIRASGGGGKIGNARVNGSRDGRIHVILGAPQGLPVVPATMPNASIRDSAASTLSAPPTTD
ncbi:lytic transglycosylase domain-containing protein [Pandoraea commovens]|uniref:Lytic transglycosylase domain-containing protein n=1 Tax=Pandoraea commovens TaxID=2508289 RepID=A0ABY5QLJ0_9BURK|nr:lytic transglycosylase domain-containing protein [Pandoraea commovens]UVA81275.1 lytic transglycosylase domain-containing protein [Pandoraea commovens]